MFLLTRPSILGPPSALNMGNLVARILYILCLLSLSCGAYDLRQPLAPLGPLGVTLDWSFTTRFPGGIPLQSKHKRNVIFSSHIVLNGPVSQFRDGQLWQIALDAYDEIQPDMEQYGMRFAQQWAPGAMTILAWDNEIILASSQKGPQSFTYDYQGEDATPVLAQLNECQTQLQLLLESESREGEETPVVGIHRTSGKCGEEMAAHLYYLYNQGRPLRDRHAVVGTVVTAVIGQKPNPKNPCGDDNGVVSATKTPFHRERPYTGGAGANFDKEMGLQ